MSTAGHTLAGIEELVQLGPGCMCNAADSRYQCSPATCAPSCVAVPERIPVTCRDARWMIITFEVPASMGYEAFRVQVPGVAGTQSLGVARMPVGSAFGGVLAPFGRPICAQRGVFGCRWRRATIAARSPIRREFRSDGTPARHT